MAGLKSKAKFLRNESTLRRQPHRAGLYKTECSARHKNAPGALSQGCRSHVRSTQSAREMSICLSPPHPWGNGGRREVAKTNGRRDGSELHTWLKYGGHLPPGPVLQRPQKLCRLEAGSHLRRALKHALSTLKERSNCFSRKAAIKSSEACMEIIAVVIWEAIEM